MRSKMALLLACAALFAVAPSPGWSQQGGLPGNRIPVTGPDSAQPFPGSRSNPEDEQRSRLEKDMAKKANQERQAQLKSDTEHLLKLATELQQYVEKSNENILSLDVVKKAEEIEKLARSVREKMKGQ